MNNVNGTEALSVAKKFILNSARYIKEYPAEKCIGLLAFSLHSYSRFNNLLIGQEKKEFSEHFSRTVHLMAFDSLIKRAGGHMMEYVPGQEMRLFSELRDLLHAIAKLREEDEELKKAKILQEKETRLNRALGLVDKHRFKGALSQFQNLSQSFPEDYDMHKAMSWALFNKSHIECLTYFEKCVAINADDDVSYAAMGKVLRKINKFDKAEECYLKALDVKPDDAVYMFNLARVYIESRRWGEARGVLERLIEIEPDLKPAQQAFQFVTSSLRDSA